MSLLRFEPLAQKDPAVEDGMVFREKPSDQHYTRITHVFPECVYYVIVTTAAAARHCGKPMRMAWDDVDRMRASPDGAWGHLELPVGLASVPVEDSPRAKKVADKWGWIEPLVQDFESERVLRKKFTERLLARAADLKVSWLNVHRALMSYYYFGKVEQALGGLAPGPKATTALEKSGRAVKVKPTGQGSSFMGPKLPKFPSRAGPRSDATKDFGEHVVKFGPIDVREMEDTLRKALTPPCKRSTMAQISRIYREGPFKKRYPEAWALWKNDKTANPVTPRIFIYRTRHAKLTEEQEANRYRPRKTTDLGHLFAKGPGEVCEVDGTGGRFYLVAREKGQWVSIGKPNIYIFIDRWSRFVLGVYMSLSSNSSQQLSKAFEYTFTARTERLARLGIDAGEDRWPRADIPAQLTTDRGPEFLSKRTVDNFVKHLRIKHTPLSAYFPDGKAIVERFIETLKQRMSQELQGAYALGIKDRDTRKAADDAQEAAVETLEEAYRILIEIVIEYNNTPHSGVAEMDVIKQRGILPTPQEAYLRGREIITGRRAPGLTDQQLAILLMTDDRASIYHGALTYKGYDYKPVDALAAEQLRLTPNKKRSVPIKADAERINLHVVVGPGRLAHFTATRATLAKLGKMTMEEDEARKKPNRRTVARHQHELEKQISDKMAAQAEQPKREPTPLVTLSREETRDLRQRQQRALEAKLDGKPAPVEPVETDEVASPSTSSNDELSWMARKKNSRSALIHSIRESEGLDGT